MSAPKATGGLYGAKIPSELIEAFIPEERENPEVDFSKKIFADFHRNKVSRLLRDAKFCAALRVLRQVHDRALQRAAKGEGLLSGLVSECQKTGPDPRELFGELMNMVPFLTALAVVKGPRRHSLESFWAIDTGKTWKAIREFPGRLQKIAKQIERLNKSPFFCPERAITTETPVAKAAMARFVHLPATLRLYANWIEMWAGRIPSLDVVGNGRNARNPSARVIVMLSSLVGVMTGGFHDNHVSDLLNSADLVLNPESTGDKSRFHPQTLADLRSRQKRKKLKT